MLSEEDKKARAQFEAEMTRAMKGRAIPVPPLDPVGQLMVDRAYLSDNREGGAE
jgi:hypothetical protein